jgi:hypothetical protein
MAVGPTPAELQTLKDLDKSIADLKKELARAKRAGIDVTELDAQLEGADKLRKGILAEYGPRGQTRAAG